MKALAWLGPWGLEHRHRTCLPRCCARAADPVPATPAPCDGCGYPLDTIAPEGWEGDETPCDEHAPHDDGAWAR